MDTENETFWVQDDFLDDSTLESLAAEDDDDAALVLQFEDAVAETVQNDAELCAFYSSYQEARKRLSEKVRFRGFWAVKRGEKGSGKKADVVIYAKLLYIKSVKMHKFKLAANFITPRRF